MEIRLQPIDEGDEEELWFEYEDDPEPDPAKRVQLLITPLTPLINEACQEKATPRPPVINGRHRGGRGIEVPRLNFGHYQRLVFQRCVKGWRNIVNAGVPVPYSPEYKAAISENDNGLLQFGYDIAVALGDMSAERVREDRANFRRTSQIS